MSMISLFSRRGKPDEPTLAPELVTGFFGKIPSRPDFVRHQVGSSVVKTADQWIHEGIAYLARRFPNDWKQRLGQFPAFNFYIAGEQPGVAAAGVIQPSQDNSGRQHPVAKFGVSHIHNPVVMLPLVPYHYEEFFEEAGNLGNGGVEGLDFEAMAQRVSELKSRIPALSESDCSRRRNEDLEKQSMKMFWDAVLPGKERARRAAFARDVMQTLKLVANRGAGRTAWGIRFPLPEMSSRKSLVSFWLSLIVGYVTDEKWQPHLFWTDRGEGLLSAMTLYFRQPGASGFAQLISPECDEGGIVDLVRRPLENMPEVASTEIVGFVADEDATMAAGLQQWIAMGSHI